MSKGVSLLAIRYARSLLTIENELTRNAERSYRKAFELLDQIFEIPEAFAILKSPVMPKDLKLRLLELAFKDESVDQAFKNFIENILDSNRVALIPDIGKAYDALLIEKHDEKKAKIISAHRLPEDLQDKIQSNLERIFGKKILLNLEVDKTLLGGFVVQVDNFLLDYSLRSAVNFSMK